MRSGFHRALVAALLLALCAGPLAAGTFRGGDRDRDAERLERQRRRAGSQADTTGLPSRGGVFLRSLLVPGWGESVVARARPELGRPGRTPFLVDVGLAVAVAGFARYGTVKRDEYQAYAQRVAGAGPHGDGSDFWVDLSNHASMEAYNEALLRSGRTTGRYEAPADYWAWPSTAQRARYRDLRAMSEDAYSRALAVGGAMVVNRLLSSVRANRLLRKVEFELEAVPAAGGAGLRLGFDLGRLLPEGRRDEHRP